jgi:hypothetical protein
LLKGIKVYGWTALMLVNLFFGGAVLISLGMLGEYLARVLMNVNQIPQFVVKERINYADRSASLTQKGDASACQ